MSTDRIYELVAEMTNRRRFLGKLGAAALSSFGIVLGLSTNAFACCYDYACCHLCQPAGPPGCDGPGGHCTWCWTCVQGGCTYQCCECHVIAPPCTANCVAVTNSWYTNLGCRGPEVPSKSVGMSG